MSNKISTDTPAYVARCKVCGGLFMAVVDMPDNKDVTGKAIAEAVFAGGQIELVTVGYVREHGLTCQCEVPPPEPSKLESNQPPLL